MAQTMQDGLALVIERLRREHAEIVGRANRILEALQFLEGMRDDSKSDVINVVNVVPKGES